MVYSGGIMSLSSDSLNYVIKQNPNDYVIGEIIMNYLVEQGVSKIFGVTGGMIYLILKYLPISIQYISTGNELHDAFSAQMYGRTTNSVGIFFATSGPGIWNATSAINNAYRDGNPLLVITGYNSLWASNDFQAYDVNNLADNTSQYKFILNSSNLQYTDELIHRAYQTAKYRNTVCYLIIDKSIQSVVPPYLTIRSTYIQDTTDEINNAKNIILSALNTYNKPLVLIGSVGIEPTSGINNILDFCSNNNVPFVSTSRARGISLQNSLNFGMIGTLGNHTANYAMVNSDVVIIIGLVSGEESSQTFFYTSKINAGILPGIVNTVDKQIISISIDNRFSIDVTDIFIELDDPTICLQNISTNNDFSSWLSQLTNAYNQLSVVDFNNTTPNSQLELYCKTLSQIYSENSLDFNVSLDTGNHWYTFQKYFSTTRYKSFDVSMRWAHIGASLPCAYGNYIANHIESWIIAGDGGTIDGLGMISYCINRETSGIESLPFTMFIFVDNYYSAVTAGYLINGTITEDNASTINESFLSTISVPSIDFTKLVPSDMLTIINNVSELSSFFSNPSNLHTSTFRVVLLVIDDSVSSNLLNSRAYEIDFSNDMEIALRNDDFDTVKSIPLTLKSELN